MPRILVVDDEPLVSMLVEDWLGELGCEVVGPARSVQQGLDIAGSASSTAPSSTSIWAARIPIRLPNALKQRGVPFAFTTGEAAIDASAGFADPILLSKPFDFEGVKAVLGKLLGAPTAAGSSFGRGLAAASG